MITKANVYTTTDGKNFVAHADAQAHQNILDRQSRVQTVLDEALVGIADANNTELAELIATLGVELLAALTLPSTRGPKRKTPVAAE